MTKPATAATEREASRAARARLGDVDVLVAQVLEVAGARSLALDALLRLSEVAWADDVATACVECGSSPRLLLNPRFVEAHCDTPCKLGFLLLHELAHISLGHSGLHTRVTAQQNVAFDAVINASLLQGMLGYGRAIDGWDALPVSHYDATRSPEFILRPPPGWPQATDWSASAGCPDVLREIHRRLYGRRMFQSGYSHSIEPEQNETVTYGEIVRALGAAGAMDLFDSASAEVVLGRLLGAHGCTEGERAITSGARDVLAADMMAEVLSKLPCERLPDRTDGKGIFTMRVQGRRDDPLVTALRQLMRRALLGGGDQRRWEVQHVPMHTPDPTRDRRAHVRRHAARLLGAPPPLIFTGETTRRRPRLEGATAIYLDVSGSMGNWIEKLHAALVPLRRQLAPRLFAFSTVVDELSRADFLRGRLCTTGGTSITPVLEHLTKEARAGRVRTALLLTDGYVGPPGRVALQKFVASGARLHVGLTAEGVLAQQKWTASITKLPTVPDVW